MGSHLVITDSMVFGGCFDNASWLSLDTDKPHPPNKYTVVIYAVGRVSAELGDIPHYFQEARAPGTPLLAEDRTGAIFLYYVRRVLILFLVLHLVPFATLDTHIDKLSHSWNRLD